jgi:hypothetical protein
MCCVIQEYVIIHEKNNSTCSRCTGGPGRFLAPPPRSVGGAVGGGRLASHILPGDFERGRGDLWQVNLAGHTRGWIWHVSMARQFSRTCCTARGRGSSERMMEQMTAEQEQVDPSLLTQEAVGHKNPEETSGRTRPGRKWRQR